MARLSISSVLISATILIPIYSTLAEEANPGGCSIMTVVSDTGVITWSTDEAAAELISIAKDTNLSPEEIHSACHGEDAVQQAESEETAEEEKVEDVAAAEESADAAGEESLMSSAGALAPLAGLGLVGGGGGGGGSSSSSTFLDESTTYTYSSSLDATWTARQEYKNASQYTTSSPYTTSSTIHPYTLIGVNYAYGMGLSGDGETVAVVDSGFNTSHEEFANKVSSGEVTEYNTLSSTTHGTHVAGTAAGDYNNNSSAFSSANWSGTNYPLLSYGMMGVAYEAKLHLTDYDVAGSYTDTVAMMAAATSSAKTAGAIAQNNSWGWGNCRTATGCSETIDVYVSYQNNNGTSDAATIARSVTGSTASWESYLSALDSFQSTGVVVVSAGNDVNSSEVNVQAGLPQLATELAEAWLVVGNIDTSGSTVSSSSVTRQGNQCGVVAEYCVQADGTEITSGNTTNNSYSVLDGTSMAAPMVSGSVALLAQAFPNHTPAQLVDRILASANNDFFTATGTTSFINGVTHGYNSEFGHGIVDLSAALQPVQTSSMIPPVNGTGPLNTRYGNINSARRFSLAETNVKLGSAFGDSMSSALRGRKAYFYDALNGGFAFDLGTLIGDKPAGTSSNLSFDTVMGGNQLLRRKATNGISFILQPIENGSDDKKVMAFIPISDTTSSFVGNDVHLQNAMSFSQRDGGQITGVTSDSSFSIPFVSASENGTSAGTLTEAGSGALSFAVFNGASKDYGLATNGFVSEYGSEIGSSYVSTFVGLTNEANGFLETSVEGAFAENAKAETTYAGVSSYGWLGSKWSYNALASVGSTDMKVDGLGMLSDLRDVTSTSFAFEIARPFGALDSDSIHIGISQPLRVERGKASVSVPGLYETGGALQYTNADVDLAPSGRQVDLNLGYQAKLYDHINVGIQMALSQDYGHVKSDDVTGNAVAFLKMSF